MLYGYDYQDILEWDSYDVIKKDKYRHPNIITLKMSKNKNERFLK